MPKVFLSYSSKDLKLAKALQKALEDRKLSVWRDKDNIVPGDKWSDRIENGIRDSRAVVVLITNASLTSHWVMFEQAFARGAGLPVLAVADADVGLPPSIDQFEVVRLGPKQLMKRAAEELHRGIRKQVKKAGEKRAESPVSGGPVMVARFQVGGGRVRRVGNGGLKSLPMDLWIDGAPDATRKVRYHILDVDFRDNPWTEKRDPASAEAFLTNEGFNSWGDIEIWAVGMDINGKQLWKTKSTLYEALKRNYRDGIVSADIRKALKQIRDN